MLGRMLPPTWESDQKQAREMLAQLGEVTEAALAEMRTLLLELRPAAILQTGLDDLLHRLAQALRTHLEKPIQVDIEGSGQLPAEVHLGFYRSHRRRSATSSATPRPPQARARLVLRHSRLRHAGDQRRRAGLRSDTGRANGAAWGSRSCANGPARSAPTTQDRERARERHHRRDELADQGRTDCRLNVKSTPSTQRPTIPQNRRPAVTIPTASATKPTPTTGSATPQ